VKNNRPSVRCGIVLAAGEGKRLQPLVRRLRGDSLPKQYVTLVGTRSMLEHTFDRAETLISGNRLFAVVGESHLGHSEAQRQLAGRPRGTVIVQPENKETGPGLLLPLMHLNKRHPDATVAVFPSDHFILEEDLFMTYVDLAFHVVEWDPDAIVLLGIEPDEAEPEYGYIVPGEEINPMALLDVRRVQRFSEKPEPRAAQELIASGGLWNTLVMVFKVKTFLNQAQRAAPTLCRSFERIGQAIGNHDERDVVRDVYRGMAPVNFSTGLLEQFSLDARSRLLVVPARGVLWSDWGSERRLMNILRKIDLPAPARGIQGRSYPLLSEKR
jgi:mannose-1-phosphate guanylyltransferase